MELPSRVSKSHRPKSPGVEALPSSGGPPPSWVLPVSAEAVSAWASVAAAASGPGLAAPPVSPSVATASEQPTPSNSMGKSATVIFARVLKVGSPRTLPSIAARTPGVTIHQPPNEVSWPLGGPPFDARELLLGLRGGASSWKPLGRRRAGAGLVGSTLCSKALERHADRECKADASGARHQDHRRRILAH